MSRIGWVFFVALVGLAIFNPVGDHGRAETRTEYRQSKPENYQQPVDISPVQDALDGIARAVKSLKDNPEADAEKRRAERDLQAQEDMAKWAERLLWATVASLLLTVAGITLIWRTLVHTKRAADAGDKMVVQAISSTKAAVDAANAADATAKIMMAVETPIVRPTFLRSAANTIRSDLGHGRTAVTGYEFFIKEVTFRNYGKTPAFPKVFRYGFSIARTTPENGLPSNPLYQNDAIFGPEDVISPEPQELGFGAPFTWGKLRLQAIGDDFKDINRKNAKAYFYFVMTYDDFSKTEHEYAECWSWSGELVSNSFHIDRSVPGTYFKSS